MFMWCIHCSTLFSDICRPVQTVAGRAELRSACNTELNFSSPKSEYFESRIFRFTVFTVWKSSSQPSGLRNCFWRQLLASWLRTWLCSVTLMGRRSYYKSHLMAALRQPCLASATSDILTAEKVSHCKEKRWKPDVQLIHPQENFRYNKHTLRCI